MNHRGIDHRCDSLLPLCSGKVADPRRLRGETPIAPDADPFLSQVSPSSTLGFATVLVHGNLDQGGLVQFQLSPQFRFDR